MLDTDENGIIRINVPVTYSDYPLEDHFKATYDGTAFDCRVMEEMLGYDTMAQVVSGIISRLPVTSGHIHDKYDSEYDWVTLDAFSGTPDQFRSGAESYLDHFIQSVFKSGGDDAHFDAVPSATEEFIFICRHTGCIDLIQKLYDSLWREGSPYHPLAEGSEDPGLHNYFNKIDGVILHEDHPMDADEGVGFYC